MSIPHLNTYQLPDINDMPENKVNWVFEPTKAVLLIHDMQQYFVNFYGQDNPLIQQVVENIIQLKRWAKESKIPVIYTAQPVEQSNEDRALLNDMWGPGLTTADPRLKEIVSELSPDEDDILLTKWRYSAFYRSPLKQIMQDAARDQLLICGVYAHIGCLSTAIDGFMQDIKPFMLADAVADFTHAEHLMALNYVAGRCGKVVTCKQLLNASDLQTNNPQTNSPHTNGPQTNTTQQLNLDWLVDQLKVLVDETDEFDLDENLIDYGLNSIQVMTLIGEWEKLGLRLNFAQLAENTSANAWWKLIEKQLQPASVTQ